MSRPDALVAAASSPAAKLLAALAGVVWLGLGGAGAALLWAQSVRADVDTVQTVTADHTRRIEALEKASTANAWNLYLVCQSAGRADCRKPQE